MEVQFPELTSARAERQATTGQPFPMSSAVALPRHLRSQAGKEAEGYWADIWGPSRSRERKRQIGTMRISLTVPAHRCQSRPAKARAGFFALRTHPNTEPN